MKDELCFSKRGNSMYLKEHGEVRILCDLQEGNEQIHVGRKL